MPTVVLARTIKGYGVGEAGEGKNITHQQKKLNEDEVKAFRTRFGIPISGRRSGEGAVLPAAAGQRRDQIPAGAPRRAERPGAEAPGPRRADLPDLGDTFEEFHKGTEAARRARRWCSCACCRSCCATSRSASWWCRSCRTKRAPSAWRRCSARSASTRTPDSSTSRSIATRCCITRKRKTGRSSKRASTKPARCRRSSRRAPPTRRTAST